MWVDVTLKCPTRGEWFALTRVDSQGETVLVAYLSREDVEKVNDGSSNFGILTPLSADDLTPPET